MILVGCSEGLLKEALEKFSEDTVERTDFVLFLFIYPERIVGKAPEKFPGRTFRNISEGTSVKKVQKKMLRKSGRSHTRILNQTSQGISGSFFY